MQQAIQFGAHGVERDGEVDVEFGGAEQLGGVTGPVLERRGGEVGGRQHQPAFVPDVQDHVGQGDLLDPAPFLLQHHDIADPDGVGEGDLDSGEHRAQRGLGGQACDDRQHAGRGEQRLPDVAERRERHQCCGATEHDDDGGDDAAQHSHLGADLAAMPVGVGQSGITAGEIGDDLTFGDADQAATTQVSAAMRG